MKVRGLISLSTEVNSRRGGRQERMTNPHSSFWFWLLCHFLRESFSDPQLGQSLHPHKWFPTLHFPFHNSYTVTATSYLMASSPHWLWAPSVRAGIKCVLITASCPTPSPGPGYMVGRRDILLNERMIGTPMRGRICKAHVSSRLFPSFPPQPHLSLPPYSLPFFALKLNFSKLPV